MYCILWHKVTVKQTYAHFPFLHKYILNFILSIPAVFWLISLWNSSSTQVVLSWPVVSGFHELNWGTQCRVCVGWWLITLCFKRPFWHLHINYRPGLTVYIYMGAKFPMVFPHYQNDAKQITSLYSLSNFKHIPKRSEWPPCQAPTVCTNHTHTHKDIFFI